MPESVVHTAGDLGVDALAAVVERSRDGIVVVTADRRYVYANPAACRIMGYSLDELRALPDFLDNFPQREHQAMLEHFAEQLAGTTGLWTSTLLRADGTEREITWTNMSFAIGGRPHGAAIFRDITDARVAARNAAALGQTAAQLAGRSPLGTVLSELARHAVEATRALACAIGIAGEDGALRAGGRRACPTNFAEFRSWARSASSTCRTATSSSAAAWRLSPTPSAGGWKAPVRRRRDVPCSRSTGKWASMCRCPGGMR